MRGLWILWTPGRGSNNNRSLVRNMGTVEGLNIFVCIYLLCISGVASVPFIPRALTR